MPPDEEGLDPIDILLVEPSPGDTRLFTEHLADAKLLNTVHVVSDGDAALDYLHGRGEYADETCPDIVLLDPELPGDGGQNVLSELNDEPALEDVPVVVLTSSTGEEEIAKARGLEADHFLQKPIDPEEFVAFVQSIEEFWLAIVRDSSE